MTALVVNGFTRYVEARSAVPQSQSCQVRELKGDLSEFSRLYTNLMRDVLVTLAKDGMTMMAVTQKWALSAKRPIT